MIWESCYWKEPLLLERKYLSRFRITDRTTDKTLAGVEKRIFISFYAIRKLIEADKLSTANLSRKFEVSWHPNIAPVDKMNWQKVDEKYDLSTEEHELHNLKWLTNQIIHSYVFILSYTETGLINGFFVASDRERNKRVYFFPRKLILDTLKLVGNDYPSSLSGTRGKDDEWIITQW